MMILPYICHQNNVLTFRFVKTKRSEEKRRKEKKKEETGREEK
jgi:hypothetical protein